MKLVETELKFQKGDTTVPSFVAIGATTVKQSKNKVCLFSNCFGFPNANCFLGDAGQVNVAQLL